VCTMPHSKEDALAFWSKRHASYPLLAPLAEDLLAVPASQAKQRVFSVCGWLFAGRRNRLTKNLEKRFFCENEPRTVVTVMSVYYSLTNYLLHYYYSCAIFFVQYVLLCNMHYKRSDAMLPICTETKTETKIIRKTKIK